MLGFSVIDGAQQMAAYYSDVQVAMNWVPGRHESQNADPHKRLGVISTTAQ